MCSMVVLVCMFVVCLYVLGISSALELHMGRRLCFVRSTVVTGGWKAVHFQFWCELLLVQRKCNFNRSSLHSISPQCELGDAPIHCPKEVILTTGPTCNLVFHMVSLPTLYHTLQHNLPFLFVLQFKIKHVLTNLK